MNVNVIFFQEDIMYKRKAKRIEDLRHQMEMEHTDFTTALQELHNKTSVISESINRIFQSITEIKENSVRSSEELSHKTDSLNEKLEKLMKSEASTSSKMQKNANAMKEAINTVSETVTAVNSTSAETIDKLTAMCTEIIAEYRRAVNESICLLMTDDLVRKIPGKDNK